MIQNAIQAGPHRGPIVVTSELAARGGVRVAIQDQGRGISRGDQGRVFDLFYTTRDNGSGIGLSIVQRVFALHGGQVELASREGEGTTVATWLPLNVPLNRPHEAFSGDRQGAA